MPHVCFDSRCCGSCHPPTPAVTMKLPSNAFTRPHALYIHFTFIIIYYNIISTVIIGRFGNRIATSEGQPSLSAEAHGPGTLATQVNASCRHLQIAEELSWK